MKTQLTIVIAVALFSAAELRAQQSAGGSSGTFGSRSMGSSFSPAASTFTGGGGAAGAGGGLGSVAGATTRGDTTAGQVTGSERFVRGTRQAGQFVGADASDATSFFSQAAALSALSSQAGLNRNTAGSDANRNSNSGNSRTVAPRIQTSIAFDFRPAPAAQVSTALETRFARTSHLSPGRIRVTMSGRTAILQGVVATEHDRDLAARATLLEAGVDDVRNELMVAGTNIPPIAPVPTAPAAPAAAPANTTPAK